MEESEWIIHPKTREHSGQIINLWPIFNFLHEKFPTDISHVDLDRVGQLFHIDGTLKKELANSLNPYWTENNPFPINSIANDEEILSIWDRKQTWAKDIVFLQQKEDVAGLIEYKNNHYKEFMLLFCVFRRMKTDKPISIKDGKINLAEVKAKTFRFAVCYVIRVPTAASPKFYLSMDLSQPENSDKKSQLEESNSTNKKVREAENDLANLKIKGK